MDGKSLLDFGANAIGGIATADRKQFFDCMDAAASDFVRRTRILTDQVEVLSEIDTQLYDLPAAFIELAARNRSQRFFMRYTDADDNEYRPVLSSFEKIFAANEDAKEIPERFCIVDKTDQPNRISGTADTDGAASGGECVLTDTSARFISTVNVRDIVHNAADGSSGIVLEVTNDTHLSCALFGGTNNAWTQDDAYVIVSANAHQLMLDAPSLEMGHTMLIPFVCKPAPVYSDYGMWRFDARSCRAIAYEAAFLFKKDYDFDPKKHEHLHTAFIDEIELVKTEIARRRLQGGGYRDRR